MEKSRRPILFFHHIPKTAGTSLRLWFWQTFGRENVFWHGASEDGFLGDMIARHGVGYFDRFMVIGGHVPFLNRHLKALGRPLIHSAVIRSPIHQVVSHFEYVSHIPGHPFYYPGSLEDALCSHSPFYRESRNMQTRFATGDAQYQEAISTINTHLFLLGSFDQLPLFITRVAELFAVQAAELIRENVQAYNYFDRHCTGGCAEIIQSITREDLALYNRVSATGLVESPQLLTAY